MANKKNNATATKSNVAKSPNVVLNNNNNNITDINNNDKKMNADKKMNDSVKNNANKKATIMNGNIEKMNENKSQEKRMSVGSNNPNLNQTTNSAADGFVMVTSKKKNTRKGSSREEFNDYGMTSRNIRSNTSILSRGSNNNHRNSNHSNARSGEESKLIPKNRGQANNAATTSTTVIKRDERIEEVTPEIKKELKVLEDERRKTENDISKRISKLRSIQQIDNAVNRIDAERKQKDEIVAIIKMITTAISRSNSQTPKPMLSKTSSADIESKLKDAKMQKKKINTKNTSDLEDAKTYINYLEGQLYLAKNLENVKAFQSRLNNMRKACEDRLRANEKLVSDAKHQERKLKSVEKIIASKKEQNIEVSEKDITKKEYMILNDHYNTLVRPHNFLGRIQLKYTVFIEKNMLNSTHDKICLTITGLEEDVDQTINYLKNIDFHEKNVLRLHTDVIKGLLNNFDGNFKRLESELNVFVQREHDTITYCGMKSDVLKFKEYLETIRLNLEKNTNRSITKEIMLDGDLARGFHKGLLKDIEKKTNTVIKMNYNDKKNEASAVIKGIKNSDIEEAEEELNNIFKGLKVHFVEMDENALSSLYRKCKYELNDMKKNLNLFILRRDDGISIIGKEENIQAGLDIIEKTKSIFLSKTVKKVLTEEEAYIFNANFKNQIKMETGAVVRIFNRSDHKEMQIKGSDEQIELATEMIDDVLTKRKSIEIEINERVVASLLSFKAQKIKEIESKTSTSIQINKNNFSAKIYGKEENIEEAKSILLDMMTNEKKETNGKTVETYEEVAEIAVESEDIGSIIGKRGQMINRIQNDSGVKKIHVDKKNKKVFIYGSASCVEKAKEKIKEAIENGKNPDFKGMANSNDVGSGMSRYGRNRGGDRERGVMGRDRENRNDRERSFRRNPRRTSGNKSSSRSNFKYGNSNAHSNKESTRNGIIINTSDEEAFPSLHDVTNVTQKKGKKV